MVEPNETFDASARKFHQSLSVALLAIGFVLGPVAIWLGILGVRCASANPEAKGMVHAITGIVLGVVALTDPGESVTM